MPHLLFVLLLVLSAPTEAQTATDPLFESHDTLKITLRGPFAQIMEERSDEEQLDGELEYLAEDGSPVVIPVRFRARGNFRRKAEVCEFPPLRLNFRKEDVRDTLFHKQDKLKLVTHCMARETRYRQGTIREYLVYRVFNTLTDKSYNARLLDITYEDTGAKRRPLQEFGIFIEHADRLSKRIGMDKVEGEGKVRLRKLDNDHLRLNGVFQYFIGNTDFSPISSADESDCCHNHHLFGAGQETYVSIPYDFDLSGFANHEYAKPNARFGIRSVTQRLYRGRCIHNPTLEEALAVFRDKREALESMVENQPELTKAARRTTTRFIRDFYKTIDDPKRVESKMVKSCI